MTSDYPKLFKKYYLLLFIIGILSLLLIIISKLELIPVALINNKIITKHEYESVATALRNYYKQAEATYLEGDIVKIANDEYELRKETLNYFINKTIIHNELKNRLSNNYDKILNNKIENIRKKENFIAAVHTLYSINDSEITNLVLIPLAEKELLDGQLFLEKNTIDSWLENERIKSNVKLFIKGFNWQDGNIEIIKND